METIIHIGGQAIIVARVDGKLVLLTEKIEYPNLRTKREERERKNECSEGN